MAVIEEGPRVRCYARRFGGWTTPCFFDAKIPKSHNRHRRRHPLGRETVPPPIAARTPVVPGAEVGNPMATRTARKAKA